MKNGTVIALLLALLLMTIPASSQPILVPGDSDGDKLVSAEELQAAEQAFSDGKISAQQLDEIRNIHENYPRTVVDFGGNEITVYRPITAIAVMDTESYEMIRLLKAQDKVVAAGKNVIESTVLYPETAELPNVGTAFGVDYEKLISTYPDLVLTYKRYPTPGEMEKRLEKTGAKVFRISTDNTADYLDQITKLGYLLQNEYEASDYISFFNQELGIFLQAVKGVPEADKPNVYVEADFGGRPKYATVGPTHGHHDMLVSAGGNNIFSTTYYYNEVSPESVAMANPDIILKYWNSQKDPGIQKELTDTASMETQRDEILKRPELANTDAIKNKRVYVYSWDTTRGGARYFLAIGYLGKWLLPKVWEDFNPREAYQEYLKRFQGVDIDVINKGVFAYPEP